MSDALLIGISARIYHPIAPVIDLGGIFNKTLHYLEQSVAHWVLQPHVLALMIPPVEREGLLQPGQVSLADYAERLDGLVLQGGTDIAPESYGETPLAPDWAGDRVRDRYEIGLFEAFVAQGKPVIGICRGCQLINVALGGTLYQDIPTQLPSAIAHRDDERYDHQFHEVSLVPGSRLAALYPSITHAEINSIHHQGIKALALELDVEALAVPDGLIEAVRWRGPSYLFGMQWHPEFMAQRQFHPNQLDGGPILAEFLDAARARRR
ncbi:gamma-glutamyl-gamma-aminobutyrate hydrolase family protein [Methylibium sp.]|uniref:gamma-glutamyl-gamma-aminobutyrate hydrolase family protein n=1 Tax=Methylibium sp. TaxID=2067992 RepID=UPI00286BB5A7|nr:gamma-glutamyl-gamma-aminobutyrate hydrolase family protein [Methylibium sp.]